MLLAFDELTTNVLSEKADKETATRKRKAAKRKAQEEENDETSKPKKRGLSQKEKVPPLRKSEG
jgi:hypothetical protein